MITVERVDVVGIARIKESFLGQTWIYALSVQKNKTEKYTIYKRWNEVYDLHHRLVKDYPATMGYEMPTFPKSHFYESKKVAEERIADLSGYFVALLECNFCRACLPLKDFLFASDADKVRHELYTAEKRKEKPERSSVSSSLEIGAPVAQAAYTLEKAWEPAEFNATMKNLLPPMKSGEKVFVIDKTEAGWWLAAPAGQLDMQQGYIQASCFDTMNESISESIECNEPCTVKETYVAKQDDELTVVKGESVTVLKKFCDGWWQIKRGNFIGTVPQVNMKSHAAIKTAPKRGKSLVRPKKLKVASAEKLI